MDVSQTMAAWLSVTVTVIGLGSLITQASIITDKFDPFNTMRNERFLGPWANRQPQTHWWMIRKPPPVGPKIVANLRHGFCGQRVVHFSRVPLQAVHKPVDEPIDGTDDQIVCEAGWAVLLGVIHKATISQDLVNRPSGSDLEKGFSVKKGHPSVNNLSDWEGLQTMQLVRCGSLPCTTIDRTTLITLLSITNARTIFSHSDAAGYRAAYASYNGQWYIEWPLSTPAIVHLTPMDPVFSSNDVQPPSYERRVDRCIQMTAGVIYSRNFKCAFPGRRPPGRYILKNIKNGFNGAHGARHLYNIMGGNAYEVDYLCPWKMGPTDEDHPDALKLILPSRQEGEDAVILIYKEEQQILNVALDFLPWSSLSWSVHRGLKDMLVAFGKPRMDKYREQLAEFLRKAVNKNSKKLEAKGWEQKFIREQMAEAAAGAVKAGGGKSADLVRVVTDIVLTEFEPKSEVEMGSDALEESTFWRSNTTDLSQEAIMGLTKFFTLEWSSELDYQLYHKLPLKIFLG